MKLKLLKVLSITMVLLLIMVSFNLKTSSAAEIQADYKVNLEDLTYTVNQSTVELKKYTQDDFETFLSDYNSGKLPEIYVTEFLFDGVSMVKTYDLDDFIESGNDVEVENLEITAVNVNTTGNIEFTGEITGGMIAVDTNGRSGEINLIFNNVKIDTDSKKTPAILVYNKDITYTGCKVTIKTASESKNYIEGGKLKKVSLVGSDELSTYANKYSGDNQTNYNTYTNYYGVYTSAQINNILFAKVQADNEDLNDGDPYYFYKAAGAVSSDIDLNFEGTGYLEVKSKNKEGIETKGNLTFAGGTGDYVIYAEDDCLNTTTTSSSNKSARNNLTIDVNSLYAVVDSGEDADEGDAIDSNGTLTINGGTIVAIAHPGQDAGLDSENGTYINGGTVFSTGDMFDQISSESKQNYMVLNFANKVEADTLITLLSENNEVLMSYKTDRTYSYLVYSSENLSNGTYYLYKNGNISGEETYGFYTQVSNYEKGTQQAYSSSGIQGGMRGGNMNGGMPEGERKFENRDENQNINQNRERSELTNTDMKNKKNNRQSERQMNESNKNDIPEKPTGDIPSENMPGGDMPSNENIARIMPDNENTNTTATNNEFKVSGISNQFSGITDYTGSDLEQSAESSEVSINSKLNKVLSNKILISSVIGVVVLVAVIVVCIVLVKKAKKN